NRPGGQRLARGPCIEEGVRPLGIAQAPRARHHLPAGRAALGRAEDRAAPQHSRSRSFAFRRNPRGDLRRLSQPAGARRRRGEAPGEAWMTHELRFALGILRRRPFQCLVQVTNRCNMQCSFCDFWPNGVPSREELTLADFQRIAGELAELGCFLVSVEGGEPFVRPDLVDIVRAFAARHLPLLYTNGWYVDEAKARALFDAGLTQVGVSIDFPDARRHDAKRGWPRAFEQARRAIATLRDAAPHGGKQVHVMTVLVQDNQEDLEALLQLSKSLGVGHCFTLLSATGFRRGHRD